MANLKERVIAITKDPKGTWPVIKSELSSVSDIYQNYLIPLAGAAAVANYLGMVVFGQTAPGTGIVVHWGFISGLFTAAIMLAFQLGMFYVSAMVLQTLAPKFGGNASLTDAFKLVAYANTPAMVVGLANIIPNIGKLVAVLGIYSIYVFWVGVTEMTGVSEQKVPYVVLAVVIQIVAVVTAALVAGFFMAFF